MFVTYNMHVKNEQEKNEQKVKQMIIKYNSNLHGSGAHIGEYFFPGSGILIITKSGMEAPLHETNGVNCYTTYKYHIICKQGGGQHLPISFQD